MTLAKFLKKVTFLSDPSPGTKLVIPDAEFLKCVILLKIELQLNRIAEK